VTSDTFAVSIVVGILTGWCAAIFLKGHGYGRVSDLLLGLMGSGVLTTVVAALSAPADMGTLEMAGLAAVGAVIMIVSQRKIWPAMPGPSRGSER
jgi:uncharacterized membrane protein YeaQ/YmgE (transglycosylase-associated protein family)